MTPPLTTEQLHDAFDRDDWPSIWRHIDGREAALAAFRQWLIAYGSECTRKSENDGWPLSTRAMFQAKGEAAHRIMQELDLLIPDARVPRPRLRDH